MMSYRRIWTRFCSARGPGAGLDAAVEAEHDGVRGAGEEDVALGDGARSGVEDAHRHLIHARLHDGTADGLYAALHITLEDDEQLLDLSALDAGGDLLHGTSR